MKILILRVSAIGDVIHTLPAIFLLKKRFKNAQISWIIQDKAASLLKGQPFIENLWILPDKFLYPQNFFKTISLLKEIKKIKWDAIIDFQGILKTSFLLNFIRGKKFGFVKEDCRQPLSSLFTNYKVKPIYENIIQKNLSLAELVSNFQAFDSFLNPVYLNKTPCIEDLKPTFHLNIPNENKNFVEEYLRINDLKKFIVLAPNTTWNSKFWPSENWNDLLLRISTYLNDYKILILGEHFGGQAKQLIKEANKLKTKIYSPPKLNLLEVAYLLTRSSLLIAPDTGILHLTDFLGCDSIGIFGPTLKKVHGPFLNAKNRENAIQIKCQHKYQKNHFLLEKGGFQKNCMYQFTGAELFEKVKKTLKTSDFK